MKHIAMGCIVAAVLWLVAAGPVHAEYMLPYPGYMPGNKLYRITRLIDRFKKPFYFGNISSYKYHLALSDKYLVEAKTLFEYKQYLLAVDALRRSDSEFRLAPEYLEQARRSGIDIEVLKTQFTEASVVHKNVLDSLSTILPKSFVWSPEKSSPTVLSLKDLLIDSVMVRDNAVDFLY